jgi:hypothetical protein
VNRWVRRPRRRSPLSTAAVLALAAAFLGIWVYVQSAPVSEPPPTAAVPTAAHASRSAAPRIHTHHRVDDTRCLAGTAALIAPAQQVHRWVDANGRIHLSDRPPASDGVHDHTVRTADREPVEVVIEQRDAIVPGDVASRARSHAIGVGNVLGDVLGLQPADGIRLRIVFAGSDAAFRAEAGPRAPSNTGVYRSAQRTMVVRVRSNLDATMRTLRHEIVHALIHEWVGSALPPAIEEGLATYFSHFETRGMGGVVGRDRLWQSVGPAAAARASDPRALRTLLALDYDGFHGARRNHNYDTATALIAGLMASEDTRALLAGLLRTQRRQTCTPINTAALLDQRWPGGVGALATRLRTAPSHGSQVF